MLNSIIRSEKKLSDKTWEKLIHEKGQPPLGKQALYELMEGKYSVIVLKNYLSKECLSYMRKKIDSLNSKIEVKQYANGALTTIGSYLAKHLNSLPEYFEKAKETDLIFDAKMDLRKEVRQYLQDAFSLSELKIASEKNTLYSPAVIRLHANGVSNPLHNDNIMRDAAHIDLILSKLVNQMSCIVCLQECDDGGELKQYNKKWASEDEQYKIPNGLGYEEKAVQGALSHIFKPSEGDIYIIDPTYYHEINKVFGQTRITMGFFFGFFDEVLQHGVVWS